MTETPHALGLVSDPDLRAELQALLPNYVFHWDLGLRGAIHYAADLRPAFLVVDIEDENIVWREIVTALQSNPATRRIPMLGIAQAQSAETMRQAKAASINGPFPRSRLVERLPDWVERRGRHWTGEYYSALEDICAEPLPELAQEGIALFNAGEYWEAHEVLEHAWIATRPHPISEVYRSILQIGVAYYQIEQGNYNGAIKMFLRAVQWLDPLPDSCQGIDLAQFKQDAAAVRSALEALGAEGIDQFDKSLFKPLPMRLD